MSLFYPAPQYSNKDSAEYVCQVPKATDKYVLHLLVEIMKFVHITSRPYCGRCGWCPETTTESSAVHVNRKTK